MKYVPVQYTNADAPAKVNMKTLPLSSLFSLFIPWTKKTKTTEMHPNDLDLSCLHLNGRWGSQTLNNAHTVEQDRQEGQGTRLARIFLILSQGYAGGRQLRKVVEAVSLPVMTT